MGGAKDQAYDLEAQKSNAAAQDSGAVFVRSGRGGAGNFVKPPPAEGKAQAGETLQRMTTAGGSTTTGSTGRGGAGNFTDPNATSSSHGPEDRERDAVKAAGASVTRPPKTGLTGRGGAGNWTDEAAQAELSERRKIDDLESRVLQDVGAGLAMPPPAYHLPDRAGGGNES